jgi:hypothetical protein
MHYLLLSYLSLHRSKGAWLLLYAFFQIGKSLTAREEPLAKKLKSARENVWKKRRK